MQRMVISKDCRNTRLPEGRLKACPSLGSRSRGGSCPQMGTKVGAKPQPQDALDLVICFIPNTLELKLCSRRGHRVHCNRAGYNASGMTPQLLGFKIVPHGLLPSTKVHAGEDGDGGVESVVVVVGGHFALIKFL